MSRLSSRDLALRYDERTVVHDLDLDLPDGSFTVIIGPNACGKSTLLKGLSRILKPTRGSVVLDGREIGSLPTKAVARSLAMLPQSAVVPEAVTVADLVGRGRYPHQGMLRQWSPQDQEAVDRAMRATGVSDLADRPVDELSGGQRQRAWLAMVLAQETSLLLLDEPTTYLDITHQVEVLDLCAGLVARGLTVVAVLHDLNQAFRYATHLVVMSRGRVVATGRPADIVTPALVEEVYRLPCVVVDDPVTGTPMVVPGWAPSPPDEIDDLTPGEPSGS